MVFDIETVGKEFSSLDEISQKYLLQYAEDEDEEKDIKDRTGFYPLTGEVVVIGALNPDTKKGIVLMRNDSCVSFPKELEEGVELKTGTEKEILEEFWKIADLYTYFISYNGRGFDAPFLMVRSAILGVRPSKNLLSNRYLSSQIYSAQHIDLQDQLTFYGASRRKFTLHMWCKAFGIKSPKEGGMSGDDVTDMFREGKILDIARYNLGDLRSTAELYRRWSDFINI